MGGGGLSRGGRAGHAPTEYSARKSRFTWGARLSEIWRAKQLEYTLGAVARRPLRAVLGPDRARARPRLRALPGGRPRRAAGAPRRLPHARRLSRGAGRARGACGTAGVRTGVLSNGDPAMLGDAVASAGLDGACSTRSSPSRRPGCSRRARAAYALVEPTPRRGPERGGVRVLEPLGHRRRGGVRLRARLGEPGRAAGRVSGLEPVASSRTREAAVGA